MLKRIISLIAIFLLSLSLASCGGKPVLLFLNWGEYIDEDMISAFEKKYNCIVLMDLAESNELFYSKVRAGTTIYDVVAPSDYMVEKMYNNGILEELDFTKLENYNPNSDNIRKGVKNIMEEMQGNFGDDIVNYFVPYLWGTWGIMYDTTLPGLEEAVVNAKSSWSPLFDRQVLPAGTKVAMYDSHQHAYYAATKYLGLPSNKELTHSKLDLIEDLIKEMNYDAWGTDNIKKDIVAGNIDLGFMWTGDFLYYYCEQIAKLVVGAYSKGEIEISEIEPMIIGLAGASKSYKKGDKVYKVGFDLFIPDDTIAFVDNLVITKDSQHKDLAYKFIDFMMSNNVAITEDYRVDPAFSNAYYVCYDTPYIKTYEEILALKKSEAGEEKFTAKDAEEFKKEANNPYDSKLFSKVYDYANALGFMHYYPIDTTKGHKLTSFSRSYVDIINTTFYNARI